jgi:organic hydroperoxide reductase OsmC/OhrA
MNRGPYFYETHLYWKGRRRGLVEVAELPPITTSAPPEFQGEPGYWTPEHLLVAALESCLMTTFLAIAEQSRLEVVSYRSSTLAKLESVEGAGLGFTRILVRPIVKVRNEQDREKARRIFDKAEKNCFVSGALSVPVHYDTSIVVSEADDEALQIAKPARALPAEGSPAAKSAARPDAVRRLAGHAGAAATDLAANRPQRQ